MGKNVVSEDAGALRVLNRSIHWATEGVVYESDNRHTDRLVVVTPAIRHAGDP